MGKVIGGMTISLDGFVNDRNGSVGKLYPDFKELDESEMLQESMQKTGAVVMGRYTYDMAQGDLTGYEYQVPIFVLTHHAPEPPKGQNENLKVFFVNNGVEDAVKRAKTAAGDKDVQIVGGPYVTQQCLKAGLLDEIQIGIMPILLGDGQPLFEQSDLPEIKLEKIRILELSGDRTDILFRVVK